LGYVLADSLVAPYDVPSFDNSAMDGYAVRAVDTVEASPNSPARLSIRETVPAGKIVDLPLGAGQAAKIMTGAPIPPGADAVVQNEEAREESATVCIEGPVKPGRNLRRAGEDIRRGERAVAAGAVLGPGEIGLAASLGCARLNVHRRPTVAIISTGSELLEVDEELTPGHIHNSNSYALHAQCLQVGIEAARLGIAPDDYESTKRLMEEGLKYDVLLTSGGVSVGEFDFVKNVQEALGVQRKLWGVAMKPGKPLVFGVRGQTLVFGLPGNPVSALVSFELFVRPALLRLMGYRKTTRPLYRAIMEEDVVNRDGRTYVVRVRAWRENELWHVSSTGPQGSGMLRSMVGANGLAFVPGGPVGVRAGQPVDFLLLREDLIAP
jgi:molybdopterin molybdotransferase